MDEKFAVMAYGHVYADEMTLAEAKEYYKSFRYREDRMKLHIVKY